MSTEMRPRPPSVELVLTAVRAQLPEGTAHEAIASVARATVAAERERIAGGAQGRPAVALAKDVLSRLETLAAAGPTTTINATGVIVHTNLGRAPWPRVAIDAAAAAASDYLLLELDRATGRRGARFRAAEGHLIALTGGDDALVTNNNASSLAGGGTGRAGRRGGRQPG